MPCGVSDDVMAHGRRDEDERPTANLLLQMLAQNDEKHEEAHARLRASIRDMETRFDELHRRQLDTSTDVSRIKATPPDATSLRFPLPMVATIVVGFLALGAGMWSFRSDVIQRLDNAKSETVSSQKLLDVQYQQLRDTIQALDRQQRLEYAEFQSFRQQMAPLMARGRR